MTQHVLRFSDATSNNSIGNLQPDVYPTRKVAPLKKMIQASKMTACENRQQARLILNPEH